MMLRCLETVLAGRAPSVGARWLAAIRGDERLRSFAALADEELLSLHAGIVAKLGRWFERSADKNEIGAFFVAMGKEYCALGLPVSELDWSLALDRKAFVAYFLEEEELDSPLRMYAMVEAADKVADFFLLGSYYLTKGYLEETVLRMRSGETLSDGTLAKYFKDDFFFKGRDRD